MNEEYLDKVSKQKTAYNELDKFEPGQGGLQYFPVPAEEHAVWRKQKAKKDMEEYEKQQKNKLDVLAMREEETRGNGHDKPQITLNEGSSSLTTCKYCNNTVGKCNCKENPKFDKVNPDHCDLKKKSKSELIQEKNSKKLGYKRSKKK